MPITIQPASLKYKKSDGTFQSVDCLQGEAAVPDGYSELVESVDGLIDEIADLQTDVANEISTFENGISDDITALNEFCHKEISTSVSQSTNVTSGSTISSATHILDASISSGTAYTFRLNATGFSTFTLYINGDTSHPINGVSTNTDNEFTASTDITYFTIYKSNIGATETIVATITISRETTNSLEARIEAIEDEIGDSVKYTEAQTLTDEQKTQACENIGALAGRSAVLPIDLDETTFCVSGKNIFNEHWVSGFISQADGNLYESSSYKASGYIEIEPNTAYTISAYVDSSANTNALRYAVYTENKVYISGAYETSTFTSPATAAYLRFSVLSTITKAQVEKGSSATAYETQSVYLDPERVWSEEIQQNVENMIEDTPLSVSPSDTTFFKPSPNLFNPSTAVANEFVVQTTGLFSSASGHTRSGYIAIEAGKPYSFCTSSGGISSDMRYAFYTSSHTFISGAYGLMSDINPVTAPANAAYIAVSALTSNMPIMVAQTDSAPAYYPYSYTYLDPQYIVSEQPNDIIINLPKNIYATEGIELNVYFENLTEDWTKYKWDVTCSVGSQMARGYTITPTSSQAGTYALSIAATTKDGVSRKVSTTLTITAASAGSGKTASLLVLGDSTTANGVAVTKLATNFENDVMSLTLLGTLGTSPYMHEGRSGWTFNQYFNTSSGNAFYNSSSNTFDASYYFSNTGISRPEWFFINLGINDTFNYGTDTELESAIDTIIGLCDDMIESVQNVSADIKIGICLTIPPNHSQDAFGKAYACNQNRDRYKRNNALWVRRQIAEYDGREADGIYLIPIHTALDTVYNMGMETLPVNARNTDVTYESPISNGGVHPVTSGYWQIADVYTAFLKAHAE